MSVIRKSHDSLRDIVSEIFEVEEKIASIWILMSKRPRLSRTKRFLKLQSSMIDYTQNFQCLHLVGTGQVISYSPVHNPTANNFERKKVAKCLVNIRVY